MPAGIGASYRSLGDLGEDVYKSTTIVDQTQTTGQSVLESVKKAFSFASPKVELRKKDPLIVDRRESVSIVSRERNRMPTAATPEKSALLGTMPSDSMDDIELKNIQLQFPPLRCLSRDDSSVREERVETDKGSLLVAVQGNRAKPAILTYHDLGLNYISSFQAFFNYIDMRVLLENFCVYHVNAPGQEEGAPTLPEDYVYPSMDELAEQLLFVLGYFGLKSVIGFGVGAGANILARFALAHPEKVNALCLINCVSTQAGWIEWGYQKLNVRHLRSQGMTQGVLDYLMWHHFGRGTEERNHDLVQVYKNYFERRVNPTNLALLIDSYVRRTDLNITRELDPTRKKEGLTLGVPVMNITGALSPHVDDTVTLNGRLDPMNSSWMKISDCGMVLEEQPGKVSEAFRLFLQGEGYVAPLSPLKMADYRLASLEGLNHVCSKKIDWPTATIHITENPISEAVVC
ncbi:protein NDRG3 isoform X2 [Bombus vosnesenskii]|uniref:Protein NDRG3 isoform X2 n=7 Tax=Apinae TaxID=70987 RepID=A0A6J3K992_9HYME|nr:protein NDRG3 isoform X2 [Bombus terrestris]XP_012242435.1 protein NDRG3 isoform X2 [Bombus impatiens]XP_033192165.1 protein NDRG3 isoform X2 [Bombus vancouverensis nearcticus]XP_033317135.1 protein NDRG3 isoform X2 [Bombus bifarius]XP_033349688.1 protein NDRG3 isoform X2 [Bombus vosnesenskii]XP_043583795.1 protein NDRG3 isoform X1 [Bombus pyrosoma]XP_050496869.1 protein NDRG3 isoform X2 [Bombus huntii]XP_050576249.1 protein NDRG3 isoform X2 [Bombus affinis]